MKQPDNSDASPAIQASVPTAPAAPRPADAAPTRSRRQFVARSLKRLVYVAPLIETFRATHVMAASAAGSAAVGSAGT